MEPSYNSPKSPEEKIKELLGSMPKMAASENFEDRLMANVRKIDQGQDVTILNEEKSSNTFLIASLSTAAGLALSFFLFNMGEQSPNNNQNATIATEIQKESPADSLKNKPKNFDRSVNLVGDKKGN